MTQASITDTSAEAGQTSARRLEIDPDRLEHDLARLVLTLIEFLRRLMEAQAVRRLEHGALTDEEAERLGQALMRSEAKVLEIAAHFGLDRDDLNLSLGPLGNLM